MVTFFLFFSHNYRRNKAIGRAEPGQCAPWCSAAILLLLCHCQYNTVHLIVSTQLRLVLPPSSSSSN